MERLWRINRVLLEKLQATGYDVPEAARQQVASLDAFTTAYPDAIEDPTSMERVFYPLAKTMASVRAPNGVYLRFDVSAGLSIRVGQVERLLTAMSKKSISTCFYVVNKPLYHAAVKLLRTEASVYRVVVFQHRQLSFNVTKHRRVPRHELLTPPQATDWLATTQLTRSLLPRIFEDDPQARYYDAQPNDLIRVTNPSPTVGEFTRMLVVVRRLLR